VSLAGTIRAMAGRGLWIALLAAAWPGGAAGHGGVVFEEDLCVIEIGLFKAHFTVYQPETRASEEFCEDVPDLGTAVFVMDYLHDSLREVPVDFRIIEDVLDRTLYANWEDIQSIPDLDAVTVYYHPPEVKPGASYTAEHRFDEKGWYIGIVTTRHPTLEKTYQAVFGFHVGGRGPGYWPWLVAILVVVQLGYWYLSGGWARWRSRVRGTDAA
jgi:hypothetical protein